MAESPSSVPAGAVGERVSYDEFLRLHMDEQAEWVEGWVYPMSPVGRQHQELSVFLASTLHPYVRRRGLGQVFLETFQMRLDESGREPDLVFVAGEHLGRVHDTYLDGPADLAIEIVSPESRVRDRGQKFFEYERAGIREYWILDPERQSAEFYELSAGGTYLPRLPDDQGIYRSVTVEGFWVRTEWLWDPPDPLDALAEIGLR
jgi:Uma2 family endonuclease